MPIYPRIPCEEYSNLRFYLPPLEVDQGTTNVRKYLYRFTDREFPRPNDDANAVYSIPKCFSSTGERQASLAEQQVFQRLHGLASGENISGLWMIFFHSTCYAGHSYRNRRLGRLIIREHDFVVFAKYQGQFYIILIEVKSNNDSNTKKDDLEKTSDAKVIKNNKRSAQHQLRDHMEVLQGVIGNDPKENTIQTYIAWPFLGEYTKDPKQQTVRRWKEDENLHVFEHVIGSQDNFNAWFFKNVLRGTAIDEQHFITLLNRFIILCCGVFIKEVNEDLLALLTQQQLEILNNEECSKKCGGALVVYGAAGTGKTLLVLRKLDQLHRSGQLNDQNRALFVCYWPGIRTEVTMRLKAMGIEDYVDTARFYVSMCVFLKGCKKKYKHIFVDEAEAISISFNQCIIKQTLSTVYHHYHAGNCQIQDCPHATLDASLDISGQIKKHNSEDWGQLWFMVDANQAQLFLPQHCPKLLKTPTLVLNKIMRSTQCIFDVFNVFYKNPLTILPTIEHIAMPPLFVGHNIRGPPAYWIPFKKNIDETIADVVIDLCSTKGIKPNDICVIPFLQNENTVPDSINKHIQVHFAENTYKPRAVANVENFLMQKGLNDFLVSWALRVKGLEFSVVIMAIEDDDFDINDIEDRKKVYIMSSRCTCMLIFICSEAIRLNMQLENTSTRYPFSMKFDIMSQRG